MALGNPISSNNTESEVGYNSQIPKSRDTPTTSIKFMNTSSDTPPSTKLLSSSDWLLHKLEDLQSRTERLEKNQAKQAEQVSKNNEAIEALDNRRGRAEMKSSVCGYVKHLSGAGEIFTMDDVNQLVDTTGSRLDENTGNCLYSRGFILQCMNIS